MQTCMCQSIVKTSSTKHHNATSVIQNLAMTRQRINSYIYTPKHPTHLDISNISKALSTPIAKAVQITYLKSRTIRQPTPLRGETWILHALDLSLSSCPPFVSVAPYLAVRSRERPVISCHVALNRRPVLASKPSSSSSSRSASKLSMSIFGVRKSVVTNTSR
jgi:hypothetical protein